MTVGGMGFIPERLLMMMMNNAVPSTLSYPTPGLMMDIPIHQNWSATNNNNNNNNNNKPLTPKYASMLDELRRGIPYTV